MFLKVIFGGFNQKRRSQTQTAISYNISDSYKDIKTGHEPCVNDIPSKEKSRISKRNILTLHIPRKYDKSHAIILRWNIGCRTDNEVKQRRWPTSWEYQVP